MLESIGKTRQNLTDVKRYQLHLIILEGRI